MNYNECLFQRDYATKQDKEQDTWQKGHQLENQQNEGEETFDK